LTHYLFAQGSDTMPHFSSMCVGISLQERRETPTTKVPVPHFLLQIRLILSGMLLAREPVGAPSTYTIKGEGRRRGNTRRRKEWPVVGFGTHFVSCLA
jgi:hypothetical protein